MNEHVFRITEAMGHWVLAWSLVVLIVGMGMRVLRPRRASVRYGGWLLSTFAGAALLPLVVVVGPRASWRELLAALRPPAAVPAREDPSPSFRSWFADMAPSIRPVEPARTGDAQRLEAISSSLDERPATQKARPGATSLLPPGDRWLLLGLGLWSVGCLIFAARLAWSGLRIRALLARVDFAVPNDLVAQKERMRRELGIRRLVRIGIHPEIVAPMCVGLFRPVILWPGAENCPMRPGEQRASLAHELAHLRHGDDGIALLAEIWRALAWFFLPIHLTMRLLHREREYRCDDVAAQTLDTPEDYALWLLDLAPVSVDSPPLLAASLLGRTSLAGRIARIIRGETRWARPLGRRRSALLVLLAALVLTASGSVRLIGFVGRAQAAEPGDAPLPPITPQGLAARIREAMKRYDDKGIFRVVFTETRDTNWKPDQKPILVTFRGRARYESDGRLWRAEYDSMMPNSGTTRLTPDRWSTGFDGVQLYDRQIWQNQFILGEGHPFVQKWAPRHVFWERSEDVARGLEEADRNKFPIAIEQRVVDGLSCYVVKMGKPGDEWGGEMIISPRRGYLPIRRVQTWKGKPTVSYELKDLHEAAPGLWAPGQIDHEWLNVHEDGTSRLEMRRRIRVAAYQPTAVVPPAAFAFEVPYDVDVVDHRSGITYHNDPWWPEIGALLRERYNWPKPNLLPLKELASSSEMKLDDQPAPPLRVATWLDSQPRDLAALRGKVVLLEFWSIDAPGRRDLVPALKRLYATYHPAGLEMIAIHAPTADPEAVRRFVQEYGITYPVAIDAQGPGFWGATAESYGSRDQTCAFLIDLDGRIHSVGTPTIHGGRLVETLVPLLQSSGAGDVKPISVGPSRLPDDAVGACDVLFNKKAKEALATDPPGRIRCRIVDEHGSPLAGANVQATLQLTILTVSTPGAYFTASSQGLDRFRATSGPDGQLELQGLCKGVYIIKAQTPGRAWAERKAILNPQLDPASVEIVLPPGLTISGQVRDEQGQAIPGATIAARNGGTRTTDEPRRPRIAPGSIRRQPTPRGNSASPTCRPVATRSKSGRPGSSRPRWRTSPRVPRTLRSPSNVPRRSGSPAGRTILSVWKA
jgi:beta-lactamase regulating signal transducer with metallopeptidase domain